MKVAEDRVVSIRGDAADPLSRGYICPKATALADIHHDPDRLKRPIKRTAQGWIEIEWDEAFDEVGANLLRIRKEHGPHAVAVYTGNPTVHSYSAALFGIPFLKALGSRSLFSATSVDQLPKMISSYLLFGHQFLIPVPDVDRTDYFLIFGGNPLISNGSLMTAPGIKHRLAAILARKGKVVLFDPRRTETAKVASEHFFIRPGTDALVLFAMLQVIFEEGWVRLGRLEPYVKGLQEVRALAQDFLPEKVAVPSGVPASVIRRIAREFATTPRAVAYGRIGISTQEFGGICNWLLDVLNIVTGHFDCEGGAMFTTPAVDIVAFGNGLEQQGHYDKFRSRVRGAPEFNGELPAACLAEEIETPGEKQIRALLTHAGNPVLSLPNGRRLDAALGKLDFMVSIDIYLNETTRHANIILPPTAALERDQYELVFDLLTVRNNVKYSPALFARQSYQRHDWEILWALSTRLVENKTPVDALLRRLKLAIGTQLQPHRIVDLLLRIGPYGLRRGLSGLSLRKVARHVHGLDLGPLKPRLPERLQTPDKKIDLSPAPLCADVARLRMALQAPTPLSPDALLLISRRQMRSNNSWCHNSPRLMKGPNRCTLRMHPDDAAARSITSGQWVRITSRVGTLEVTVELTDEMMRGVVSLPHGFGHNREGTRWRVAEAHAGASINDLTDEAQLDSMSGTVHWNGIPVQVFSKTEEEVR